MSERHYFEIGWDTAAVGLPMPGGQAGTIRALREGFLQGCFHFGSATKRSDEFTRKWLHLRLSAAERKRQFDESVTPDYLRLINRQHCPVTGERLSYGLRLGSDWSVDRLVGDAAYSRGNLCMMSARANVAKGNHTIAEILNRAWASRAIDGLEPRAWERLYGLMAGVMEFVGGCIMKPLTCIPGQPHRDQLLTGIHAAQLLISTRVSSSASRELDILERTVPRMARPDWEALVALVRLRLRSAEDPLEIWLERDCLKALGRVTMCAGDAWLVDLKQIEAVLRPECPKPSEAARMRARFALSTRGYETDVLAAD